LESVKTADLLAGSRRTIKILLQVKALRPLSSHDPAQTSLIKFAVGAGVVATVANQNKPIDRRLMGSMESRAPCLTAAGSGRRRGHCQSGP
jgi:hypothetical protein